jgi:hypothetical protein
MKKFVSTVLIILAFIGFILGMIFFFVWKTDEIPTQIIGVLFGTIVTSVVTLLLLSAQTESEEKHEVSGKIFDKKTEAYLQVLESLENIISDGKVDTIKDNRLEGKKDELSELLFGITRLSSFIEADKKEKNAENKGVNTLIEAVTKIIKATKEKQLPSNNRDFWDGKIKGKETPNDVQKSYYKEIIDSLKEINTFAAKNIRRSSDKKEIIEFSLEKLIEDSSLFEEDKDTEKQKAENKILQEDLDSGVSGKSLDFRKTCLADCLEEMQRQLNNKFGNTEREGNAGDDYYWGRWKNKDTTAETIADWLLDKKRRSEIGYKVDFTDGYGVEFCIYGDAKTFGIYVFASKDILDRAETKREAIKNTFNNGWWIPDSFVETGWIIGGCYGGDYNGVNISFDFRNANNLPEAEYKAAYQKFKENAIYGIISGRDDSIEKAVEELRKVVEG